jgi:hypothetical protein
MIAVAFQLALLLYHQITTWFDFFPFNGSRHYGRNEKLLECGVNGVLMLLPPLGFGFQISWLMHFGVVYYFVLFSIELLLWWVPYLMALTGSWRTIYNSLLLLATLDFGPGDRVDRWHRTYHRLHRGTITLLPTRGNRPVPNLEHMILQAWTLITALVTAAVYLGWLE